ncbi:hypothetical protein IV203_025497 [Nitzschia inconspicua]|uniref:Uncharacterized protein n=1 Tax=Nitzschia inconspicua TaxID=303405 RepID=A0A9K3KBD6_9STRA|nr:hypothetical protein IV203_028274 [Nitzschia inconspicua]KAG7362613.1 hypothetical protein IV203_025497 [Nitzschia inconspicua]
MVSISRTSKAAFELVPRIVCDAVSLLSTAQHRLGGTHIQEMLQDVGTHALEESQSLETLHNWGGKIKGKEGIPQRRHSNIIKVVNGPTLVCGRRPS